MNDGTVVWCKVVVLKERDRDGSTGKVSPVKGVPVEGVLRFGAKWIEGYGGRVSSEGTVRWVEYDRNRVVFGEGGERLSLQ